MSVIATAKSTERIEMKWSAGLSAMMTICASYTELQQYAEEKDARLAFSRPQFEAYLLQHFEQSAVHDQKQLYSELSRYASEHLHDAVSYEKANLDWQKDLIDIRPKLVDIAITNADQHAKQSGRVFLTVQQLVKRMRELAL